MPFSKMASRIPVLLEQLRDGFTISKAKVANPMCKAARMSTCHEANSTRLTGHSRGIVPHETRTVFGEAVDIRRYGIRMAVAS